jgi:hypothetical protein
MGVHILDRVLDSDYMCGLMQINVVDHSCQRCGLTGTGRAGNKHQSTGTHSELCQYGGQVKVGQRRYIVSQKTDSDSGVSSLSVNIDTVTEASAGNECEVGIYMILDRLTLLIGTHILADMQDIYLGHVRIAGKLSKVAALTDDRGNTYCEMQVGASEGSGLVKDFVDIY